MNTAVVCLGVLAWVGLLSGRAAAAPFLLLSPDEPPIWYNRAGDKIDQDLSWNASRQELFAHVSYDEIQSVPLRDQFYYDNFKLSFPMVHLDPATKRLFFVGPKHHREEIGRVDREGLGGRVTLDPEVHFAVFRQNGVVHAAISSAPLPLNR